MNAHQSPERLSAYLEADLPTDEAAAVEAHLDGCETCRSQADALGRAMSALRTLPTVAAPPDLVRNVRRRVRRRGVRQLRTGASGLYQELLTGAVLAVLVGVVVLSGRMVRGDAQPLPMPDEAAAVTGHAAGRIPAVRVRFAPQHAAAARTFVDGAADLGAQLAVPGSDAGVPLAPGTPVPDEGLLLLVPEPALSFIVPEGVAHLDAMVSPTDLRDEEARFVEVLPRGWVLVRLLIR